VGHFWTRNLLKRRVLTASKLGEVKARLEHTTLKSMRRLTQRDCHLEIVSRKGDESLTLRPYKATVARALPPRDRH